jgi:hypothetical protein
MLPASDLAEGLFNNVDRPPVCDARGPGRPFHGVRYGQARGANRTGEFVWVFEISGCG